jgi:hypothetical protein
MGQILYFWPNFCFLIQKYYFLLFLLNFIDFYHILLSWLQNIGYRSLLQKYKKIYEIL